MSLVFLFLFRRVTNKRRICQFFQAARSSLFRTATSAVFGAGALSEELAKEFTRQTPVLFVDAVFHLRRLNLTLYQTSLFQCVKMLRHGSFGNRQLLVDIAEIAGGSLSQEGAYRNASGVRQRLGKLRQKVLFDGVIALSHFVDFSVRKYTNNMFTDKANPTF